MSQQQSPSDASIDGIPVDVSNTRSGKVHASDVPEEIRRLTCGLARTSLSTNPLVVLKVALWWYLHGKGGLDPAYRWAIEWAHHLATDSPSDVELFDEFLEYLVTVAIANATDKLR